MEAPARVALQTFHQPTNQPTNQERGSPGRGRMCAALKRPSRYVRLELRHGPDAYLSSDMFITEGTLDTLGRQTLRGKLKLQN